MSSSHEQLILDILANTTQAERGIGSLGRTVKGASDDVMGLAGRLDELGRKTASARVKLEGNTEAQAQLDKLDAKMLAVGRRVMDPNIKVEGVARASLELGAISAEIDKVGKAGETAAGPGGGVAALAGTGGGAPTGIAALVGACVALSPVLITVGFGLVGFGAAAAGAAAPILKAAQAAGGLQANMKSLNPEQRKIAQGLLDLGQQYSAFEKQLQPEVFRVFNQGLHLAGNLMGDLEPVAKTTGNALAALLGSIDREFQSGTWRQFFGFMARTAAGDVRLLGNVFTGLLQDLPPLLEKLQPLSAGILKVAGSLTVMISNLEKGNTGLESFIKFAGQAGTTGVPQATHSTGLLGAALHFVANAGKAGSTALREWTLGSGKASTAAGGAAKSTGDFGSQVGAATPKVLTLKQAVTGLTAAMAKNDAGVLTLQGDVITWRQSLNTALKQLNSNSAGLKGNSANALANQAAVLASSQAAQTLAEKQLTMRNGMIKASDTIQAQIRWLQQHGDKSAFAAREIQALRDEEAKIKAQIRSQISVTGHGSWNVTQGIGSHIFQAPGHAAGTAGAPPGWAWVGERGPELAYFRGGETVLPSHVAMAVATPPSRGFAGGVAGSFSGSVPGLTGWVGGEMKATNHAIQASVAAAIMAGIRAAQSSAARSAQTFGGGLGRASLRQIEDWWIGAGGPGGGTAHVAAAITGAESGFNPQIVQQGQPYATTGWGLWQITPGDSEPQAGINQQLLNGPANAKAAVAKYRGAGGFSPWTTFVDGAYLQFMDRGGWLPPGPSLVYNGTGQAEHLTRDSGSGGTSQPVKVVVEFRTGAGASDLERGVIAAVQKYVIVHGGDAQAALGQRA